jgi:fructose/tagatose bisphosphate aldolase
LRRLAGALVQGDNYSFRPFVDFDRSASKIGLAGLASGLFLEGRELRLRDEFVTDTAIEIMETAEEEILSDERASETHHAPEWLTSAGIFSKINGDRDLHLFVMHAIGKKRIKMADEGGEVSPSIAQQVGAQALFGRARTLYADVMKGHDDGYIKLWGSVDEMLDAHRDIFMIGENDVDDDFRMAMGEQNSEIFNPEDQLDLPGTKVLDIFDEPSFRLAMDDLVRNSVFNPSAEVRDAARWIIWEASQELEAPSSSIHDLYMARGEGKWDGMTVPAINVRGLTYDMARLIFRKLKEIDAGAAIFEIAKSEIGYTDQRPAEYTATVLAAAIREGWEGPVFLQGDHFQVGLKDYKADPKAAVEAVKGLIREAVEAGFYNIDIDTSTLVDLDRETIPEQQRDNYEVAAELTRLIREIEPEEITVSVGGEIGEIGTGNSTPEELRAFMDGYNAALGPEDVGISKISIQTGTSHGGVPLRDGSIAEAKIDFDVIAELGRMARQEYGIGGVVQHGASTLPDEAFFHFRDRGAMEVHLATAFQNGIYDSPAFLAELTDRILQTIRPEVDAALAKAKDTGKDLTEAQAVYKLRKKGFRPHKREMWSMPLQDRAEIMAELAVKFGMLFGELGVADTRKLVNPYVRLVEIHKPFGGTIAEAVIEDDGNPNAD